MVVAELGRKRRLLVALIRAAVLCWPPTQKRYLRFCGLRRSKASSASRFSPTGRHRVASDRLRRSGGANLGPD
jgi:hypothetical protein